MSRLYNTLLDAEIQALSTSDSRDDIMAPTESCLGSMSSRLTRNVDRNSDDCIFIMNGRVFATGWMAVQMKHQVEAAELWGIRSLWGEWASVPVVALGKIYCCSVESELMEELLWIWV